MQKSIVPFGAFVDIGSTSDGLVHISEIADQYVRDVNEFVSRGDTVDVVLLKVVGDSKLSLSMKAVRALLQTFFTLGESFFLVFEQLRRGSVGTPADAGSLKLSIRFLFG